jgi:hypothetical protein
MPANLDNLYIDPAVGALIEACLAVLFATAALHKLRDLQHFQAVLSAYALLPRWLEWPVARVLPLLELAVAAGLLLARWQAALAALGLLVLYAGAIGVNLWRGRRDVDCGCGAPQDRRPIGAWMVWRNLTLALALASALLPWDPRPLAGTDLITIAFGAVSCILIYFCVDRLLATAARLHTRRT